MTSHLSDRSPVLSVRTTSLKGTKMTSHLNASPYALLEPWAQEPDYAEFTLNGFTCVIRRPYVLAHLCGYVGLPEGHKAFGKHYDVIEVNVHGGLTYSKLELDGYKGKLLWWIGFDCDRSGDFSPYYEEPDSGEVYRTFGYVFAQLQSLTLQLQETTP